MYLLCGGSEDCLISFPGEQKEAHNGCWIMALNGFAGCLPNQNVCGAGTLSEIPYLFLFFFSTVSLVVHQAHHDS